MNKTAAFFYLVVTQILNKIERRFCENVEKNVLLRITILVDKAVDIVDDCARVMSNAEFAVPLSTVLTLHVVGI